MINRIRADIKQAMLDKDTSKKDVLKLVVNRATLSAKEAKTEIDDEIVMDAIKKENKQLQDTLDILNKNNKTDSDLYIESVKKQEILKSYLPKQLSEDELKAQIKQFVNDNNIDTSNKGVVMKSVMPKFKSLADGKMINKVVCEIIG